MDDASVIREFVETLDDLTDRKKGNLARKLIEEYREIRDMYPNVHEYVYELTQPGGLEDF